MRYKYSKFTGDLADELSLEDLVSQLSDLLLFSGFGDQSPHADPDTSMQANSPPSEPKNIRSLSTTGEERMGVMKL